MLNPELQHWKSHRLYLVSPVGTAQIGNLANSPGAKRANPPSLFPTEFPPSRAPLSAETSIRPRASALNIRGVARTGDSDIKRTFNRFPSRSDIFPFLCGHPCGII